MSTNFIDEIGPYERRVDIGAIAAGDHRISCKIWPAEALAGGTAFRYVRTPPGEGSDRGFHAHSSPQYMYVLEGQLVVEVEGEEPIVAGPHTCVAIPPLVTHRTVNLGQAPCTHLSVGG